MSEKMDALLIDVCYTNEMRIENATDVIQIEWFSISPRHILRNSRDGAARATV